MQPVDLSALTADCLAVSALFFGDAAISGLVHILWLAYNSETKAESLTKESSSASGGLMSAFVALTLTFHTPVAPIEAGIGALKAAGWHVARGGSITYLVDRTDDYTWQSTSAAAEQETLHMLDRELAAGAKAGICLYSHEDEDRQVAVTFTTALSISASITADRLVIDIGNGQELTDMSWYVQRLVRPLCESQPTAQLESFQWGEVP